MRKIFDEFFYVSKHGKVREKVVLSRLISMVAVVLFCLAAMGITAYAYFSHNITSKANVIKAARFEATVSITMNGSLISVAEDGGAQTANLEAGQYTIELSAGDSTAHKGFCIITIGDKTYYTDQIGVDSAKNLTDAVVKFDLLLSAPSKIKVSSHWGTSSFYGYQDADRTEIFVQNGETLVLPEKAFSDEGSNSEEGTDQPEEPAPTPPKDAETEPSNPSNPIDPLDTPEEPAETEPQESLPEETPPITENAEIINSSTPEASE